MGLVLHRSNPRTSAPTFPGVLRTLQILVSEAVSVKKSCTSLIKPVTE